MSRILLKVVCLIATLMLLSCQPAEPPSNVAEKRTSPTPEETKKAPATDLEALSNRLVTQVAGIKKATLCLLVVACATSNFSKTSPPMQNEWERIRS